MNDVLVCGEFQEDSLTPVTLELLGIGKTLADKSHRKVGLLLLSSGLQKSVLDEGVACGADKVYVGDSLLLKNYQPDAFVTVITDVCQELKPDIVLLGHTSIGRDLAPRLAFRLRVSLVTDCVSLAIDPQTGQLVRMKPVYGGNVLASYISEAKPQITTVRPKSMPRATNDPSRQGEIVFWPVNIVPDVIRSKLISMVDDKGGAGKKLEAAEVVVCGGRGVGSAENFRLLQELARLLNGAVGASRPPCDLGWVPCDLQIGLSGKVVAPGLYVAVAVSGSSAHLAGCGNSKNIIAINTDTEANIFNVSHYGIIADFKKALPLIIETYKRLTGR